jgi:ribose transport system ATP-binding protein
VPGKALQVSNLRKHYGSTVALDGAGFEVEAGTVHALLGENGAGKSTIVKLLSGLTHPDGGEIRVFGTEVSIRGPRAAHLLGIRTAFQEISLVKDLTVAQNFLLMEEPVNRLGLMRKRHIEELTDEQLRGLGLNEIDPRAKVDNLDLPTRQKIEIARSVSRAPRLLLLDEPTASLSSRDVQWLAGLIERVKIVGTTVILISHLMQEARELCSAMTILRNGKAVGSYAMGEISDDRVIELMIGRSLDVVFPPKRTRSSGLEGAPALAVRRLSAAAGLIDVSFDLWAGRILGVGGLEGMGQRRLFLALFGAVETSGGEICIDGAPVGLRSPADAVRAGIGLVPEDRKTEGLLLELDGQQNVALPSLRRFLRAGLVDRRREAREVLGALARVQVPPSALVRPVKQFSGGNQQKIAIAKWLLTGSRILLLYDPTRGVDVGTKAEIYRLVHDFAASGGAVLLYSTDIAELVNLCDEVLVLYRGRVTDILTGEAITDTQIMRAALGHARSTEAADGGRLH